MRKILSLILILALVFTVVACADNVSYDNDEDEKTESKNYDEGYDEEYDEDYDEEASSSPKTIMDLFDGERRVWYFINASKPAYDSPVNSVIVTEDKQIVELYYTLDRPGVERTTDGYAPFLCDAYELSDFDGMSDEEILEMVRENYADASETYEFTMTERYGGQRPDERNCKFKASKMPYDIEYSGELDDSGNEFEWEIIRIFEKENFEGLGYSSFNGFEYNEYISGSPLTSPTTVKNEEYVGLKYLITRNTYASFENITFDDIDGMADWDYNYYRY